MGYDEDKKCTITSIEFTVSLIIVACLAFFIGYTKKDYEVTIDCDKYGKYVNSTYIMTCEKVKK